MTALDLPEGLKASFAADGDGCRLVAGRCPRTGRVFFPAPAYCPCCLEPPERLAVSGRGRVHAFTVVRTKAPFGLPEPYAVGYVDIDEADLRVFGLFAPETVAALEAGSEVDLALRKLGTDAAGRPCLRPVFTMGAPTHG